MTEPSGCRNNPPICGSAPERLVSLDAYRGAIMLLMASGGLGLARVAQQHPASNLWQFIAHHTEHAAWAGFTLWDIIQPAFMFMVGVALPWSVAKRTAQGERFGKLFLHALWRSLVLVLLAVFLTSAWSRQTEWFFTNVLAQIGLGYPVVFLLAFTRPRTQWLAAFGILLGYWLAFALYPLPTADFDWQSVGVPADWSHLTGFAAHWEKNANVAAAFDRWFLNLFPREKPFAFSTGGYQTLNFIPSIATMVSGLLAGELMKSGLSIKGKLKRLVLYGTLGVILGKAIALASLCPIVKRLWTPSWTIYSAGWATLVLASFVALIEWRRWRGWTFPLVVVGLNPITLYVLWQLSAGFIRENIRRHLGQDVFERLGAENAPILERAVVLLVLWLILLWMYRRKIFLRI